MSTAERAQIQVVSRVARILQLLSRRRELRVAEVASELGLQRSTAHRYMVSLSTVGLLQRNEEETGYHAGPLLLQSSLNSLGRPRVLEIAGAYMHRLAEEAHETVVLSLWAGEGPVVARAEEDATRLVHVAVRVGSPLPLDSAQAQVFLAHLPDRALRERLLLQLPPLRRREVQAQIEHVLQHGIAIDSRVIEGIRAVAAPVLDDRGAIAATIAFVGTTSAIPEDRRSGLARALVDVAQQLSGRLGYRPMAEVNA